MQNSQPRYLIFQVTKWILVLSLFKFWEANVIKYCGLMNLIQVFFYIETQYPDILPIGLLYRRTKGQRNGISPPLDHWKSKVLTIAWKPLIILEWFACLFCNSMQLLSIRIFIEKWDEQTLVQGEDYKIFFWEKYNQYVYI